MQSRKIIGKNGNKILSRHTSKPGGPCTLLVNRGLSNGSTGFFYETIICDLHYTSSKKIPEIVKMNQ